jgi:hypothetical protein
MTAVLPCDQFGYVIQEFVLIAAAWWREPWVALVAFTGGGERQADSPVADRGGQADEPRWKRQRCCLMGHWLLRAAISHLSY